MNASNGNLGSGIWSKVLIYYSQVGYLRNWRVATIDTHKRSTPNIWWKGGIYLQVVIYYLTL